MPELPEVETVRRGLEPGMAGKRFVRVIVRRPDLRAPFPHRFSARLAGKTALAVQRRANTCWSAVVGDTLVMHLDVGPFGSTSNGWNRKTRGTITSCSDVVRRGRHFQRSPAVRVHGLLDAGPWPLIPSSALGPSRVAAFNAAPGAGLQRETTPLKWRCSSAWWPDWKHLRRRGALSRPLVTRAAGVDHRHAVRRAAGGGPAAGRGDQAGRRRGDRTNVTRRVSIGEIPRLRPRRRTLPAARMRRDDRAADAGRPLDVLLSTLSALGVFYLSAIDVTSTIGPTWWMPMESRRMRASKRTRRLSR